MVSAAHYPLPSLFLSGLSGTAEKLNELKRPFLPLPAKVANNWGGFKIQRFNPLYAEERRNEVNGTE